MKTIFDKPTRDGLIARINTLNQSSTAQWGKMNVYQMVKHCRLWEEMVSGAVPVKRVFIGRLFGKIALKNALKEGKIIPRNAPTSTELIVKDNDGSFELERKKWIELLEENASSPKPYFMHPFFGKMTTEQLGYHAYMHVDHHLRQFNS